MSDNQCYVVHFLGCSLHVAVNVSLSSFVVLRIVYMFIFNQFINISDEIILMSVKSVTMIISIVAVGVVYVVEV